MKHLTILAASAALALTLSACGEEPDNDATMADRDTAMTDQATGDAMGTPMAGTLSTEQQTRFDAMDRQAVSDEYDRNSDAMRAASGSGSMEGTTPSADATGTQGANAMDGSTSGQASGDLRPRGQMDFAFLDRNGDGKLSVAEYAIWAVPADPDTPVANDEKKPYLTPEQINQAGQTFFYFDKDGDSYLSQSEFGEARNSAMTPGGSTQTM